MGPSMKRAHPRGANREETALRIVDPISPSTMSDVARLLFTFSWGTLTCVKAPHTDEVNR